MSDKEVKVLIFNVNEEYYAADIMEVERILGYEESTKMPETPDFVEGVLNYQGSILPIINLSKKFHLVPKERTGESKIVVAKDKEEKIGIIVDFVSEVKDIKESDIEIPPEITSEVSKRYMKGLIKIDNNIIKFLNISAILTDEEKSIINKE